MTEDEMDGWHCRLGGHGFEWAPGDDGEWGGPVCCSPCGCRESDTTEQLDNNNPSIGEGMLTHSSILA